jgi:Tol biopolymer transport system component
MSNRRASGAALVLASSGILLLLVAPSAEAAYPGHNGHILFQRFHVGGPPGANGSFWEMDPDGGSEHRVTPAAPRDRRPVWSPDGSRFAFIRIKNRGSADRLATIQLMVMDADGSDLRVVGRFATSLFGSPMWSPDGSRIAVNASVVCGTHHVPGMTTIDVRTHEQKAVCPKGPGLRKAAFESWSSTGLIAFVTNAGAIGTMTPTGRHVRRVTPKGVSARDPDWSPDGRHLVWASLEEDDFSILVMDRRGRHVRRLTGPHPFPESVLTDSGPAYSPNGERIVFDRCCFGPSKTEEIFVMHADGSSLRRLTHNRAEDYDPNWQPR